MRLACIRVPLFPLAARLRSEPELVGAAVAVMAGNGNAARVSAASRRARRAGVRSGMSLAQARALLPDLTTRSRDVECETSAQQSLLEVAERISPRIEDGGEGIVFLDLTGLERHFPDEAELGRKLMAAVEATGLSARVGVATGMLAARIAAEQPGSPTVIPAGGTADFLAPLPLTRLSPELETLETLRRWGVRSAGELARLPAAEVASRLGGSGSELHRQARGLDGRPLVPHRLPQTFDEGLELEWALTAVEPFLFVARAALDRLCDRLSRRGLACARLGLSLRLEPDGHDERSVRLPAPTTEGKTLLTLLRLDLERHPPGAPVCGFTLTAHPDRPREAQLSLFGPAALSPDRLATTLARLFSLLGPDRLGSPRSVDAHRPEAVALVEYFPPPPPDLVAEPHQGAGLLAVRALRPPLPLEVLLETSTPTRVRSLATDETAKRPPLDGAVRVASGPWHLEDAWWSPESVTRDYWDVELTDGGIYRIYRDRESEDWYADGIYD